MFPLGGGLALLEPDDWRDVHALMVAREFPNVPDTFAQAMPYFGTCTMVGARGREGLRVVFVLGQPDDGIAFLDVVCAAPAAGMWATRVLMGALARYVFVDMGLRCVWVQVHGKTALKAALKAGFKPLDNLRGKAPVLAMTPLMAKPLMGRV